MFREDTVHYRDQQDLLWSTPLDDLKVNSDDWRGLTQHVHAMLGTWLRQHLRYIILFFIMMETWLTTIKMEKMVAIEWCIFPTVFGTADARHAMHCVIYSMYLYVSTCNVNSRTLCLAFITCVVY